MRQRGFGWIEVVAVLAAAAALIAALWGGLAWHANVHFKRGQADVQGKWDKAELAAEAERRALDVAVAGALDVLAKQVGVARAEAEKHKTNWQEARDEARRNGKQLGSCEVPGPDQSPSPSGAGLGGLPAGNGIKQGGVAGRDPGIRLHWRFVGLYDGAHSDGITGKPLFGATQAYAFASERADTPSPYGLDELIDNVGTNAERWANCRRDLNAAISEVEAAEAAWNSAAARGGDRDARERAAAP